MGATFARAEKLENGEGHPIEPNTMPGWAGSHGISLVI